MSANKWREGKLWSLADWVKASPRQQVFWGRTTGEPATHCVTSGALYCIFDLICLIWGTWRPQQGPGLIQPLWENISFIQVGNKNRWMNILKFPKVSLLIWTPLESGSRWIKVNLYINTRQLFTPSVQKQGGLYMILMCWEWPVYPLPHRPLTL